jgi:hypothetical protein
MMMAFSTEQSIGAFQFTEARSISQTDIIQLIETQAQSRYHLSHWLFARQMEPASLIYNH